MSGGIVLAWLICVGLIVGVFVTAYIEQKIVQGYRYLKGERK